MMHRIAVLSLLFFSTAYANEQNWRLTAEGGVLFQTKSDVEIPPGTGTRFSLVDAIGKGPLPFVRFEGLYAINPRHRLRLLIAPLVIEKQGSLNSVVVYNGKTFAANTNTTYRYQFNSYRLGYAWRFQESEDWSWDVGFTAKIRQAEIALTQGSTETSFPDLGFVPLIHLRGEWHPDPVWQMQMDLDAIGSPYGRAIDTGLFLHRVLSKNWQLGVGYRTVEGGADVSKVYNFAWIHYFGLRAQANF